MATQLEEDKATVAECPLCGAVAVRTDNWSGTSTWKASEASEVTRLRRQNEELRQAVRDALQVLDRKGSYEIAQRLRRALGKEV